MEQKTEAFSRNDVFTSMAYSKSNAIRITVPANVANDLTLFTNMLKELGGRIGCKQCISGAACFFDNERDFVVNPEGRIMNFQH